MKGILAFLVLLSASVTSSEDFNLVELHNDTFYKVVHDINKHVVVELYSSESWCSKHY